MKFFLLILILCAFSMPSCKKEVASNKYDLDSFQQLNPKELFKKIEVILLDSVPDRPISKIEKTVYHEIGRASCRERV